jgi:hypothetical protein
MSMEEKTMEWMEAAERFEAATAALESAVAKLMETQDGERVGKIVATVESEREVELMRRLEEAEAKIEALTASGGRKTSVAMVAKEAGEFSASALDAALASLSVEQRIAVKAELLRAGVVA